MQVSRGHHFAQVSIAYPRGELWSSPGALAPVVSSCSRFSFGRRFFPSDIVPPSSFAYILRENILFKKNKILWINIILTNFSLNKNIIVIINLPFLGIFQAILSRSLPPASFSPLIQRSIAMLLLCLVRTSRILIVYNAKIEIDILVHTVKVDYLLTWNLIFYLM